jgi:hypothetical protein
MLESDQFRQYADEALLWAAQSKTEEEKRLLFELVLTWTQVLAGVFVGVGCQLARYYGSVGRAL